MTISTTFQNGAKEITLTLTSSRVWEKEDRSRVYHSFKSSVSNRFNDFKIYEVVEGGYRLSFDDVLEVDGRTFVYSVMDCDSHKKKDALREAAEDLVRQIIAQ